MGNQLCLCRTWRLCGGETILTYQEISQFKYILYGYGIGNKAVAAFFDKKAIAYTLYSDGMDIDIADLLENYQVIIKSSGIRFDTEFLKLAEQKERYVISDLELYAWFYPDKKIIGITGSNGKTTTTTLIGKILEQAYGYGIGGNIGIPLFSLPEDLPGIVMECSSFMLHSTKWFHPQIFVLLNVEHHHLNMHKTFSNYVYDKMRPLLQMTVDDVVVYNSDDLVLKRQMANYKVSKRTFSMDNPLTDMYINQGHLCLNQIAWLAVDELKLQEKHIIQDMMAAVLVATALGVSDDIIKEVLRQFTGLHNRLEIIYKKDGWVVFNDSKATNPYATVRALETIHEKYPFHPLYWLVGGEDQDEDCSVLLPYLKYITKGYFYGQNRHKLLKVLGKECHYRVADQLTEALEKLIAERNIPGIILLSPASASHDAFQSFEERGQYFVDKIYQLLK